MKMQTIREASHGKLTLRLLAIPGGYKGLVVGGKAGRTALIEGTDAEDVWRRLMAEAGKASASYFGFDGARTRFLRFFPQGFQSHYYADQERTYKLAAKQKLDATLPLADVGSRNGMGEVALRAYQATNLLPPFEKAKLSDALRSSSGDAFVRAAAAFTLGEGKSALHDMDQILRPFDCARWTIVTYLPFLWRPDVHAFLKPTVTRDFADRVGHRFAQQYQARLDFDVYQSLLDLYRVTKAELADLNPQDNFDVQSLVWVVGAYTENDLPNGNAAKSAGSP